MIRHLTHLTLRLSLSTCALTGLLALAGCSQSGETGDEETQGPAAEEAQGALSPSTIAARTGAAAPKKGEIQAPRGKLTDHLQFEVELPATWPAPVSEVALYKVVRGAPPADVTAMERMFGVAGAGERSREFGGLVHVREGQRHVYVFDTGGAVYHDVDHIGSTREIEPFDDESLWEDASRRVAELHLTGPGMPELVRGRIVTARAATGIRTSVPQADWPVAQSVTFEQRLDGLPMFGAGNDVQLVYGEGGSIVSFTSQVRPLEKAGTIAVDSAEEAVGRYLDRANRTGRWNLAKAFVKEVRKLTIDHAQLGYYLPSLSVPCEAAEPVYAIAGFAEGLDGRGRPTTVPVLWVEPAAPGRTLADIHVSSEEAK